MATVLPTLKQQNARAHAVYRQVEDHLFRTQVAPRVTPQIIAEHRERPVGKHSDDLERVLIHLRKNHMEMGGKYIIVCTRPHEEWRLAVLSGVPGVPPSLTEEAFPDRFQAEHGLFLRRLADQQMLPEQTEENR